MRILLYTIFLIIFLDISCSESNNQQEFIINGKYYGENTKFLMLIYPDFSGDNVIDTIYVKDNKFQTKGKIDGGVIAILTDNESYTSFEDPNVVRFFLEPSEIRLSLNENHFKNMKVEGSYSHIEYMRLMNAEDAINKISDKIKVERAKLAKKRDLKASDTTLLNNKISSLDKEWNKIRDSVKCLKFEFATENPNSFVSPYALDLYFKTMPVETLNTFYEDFGYPVRNSYKGKQMKSIIDVRTNKLAKDFKEVDFKSQAIRLKDFEGKYVLLDFWAGWCKPCLEKHPKLKEIYKMYHPKGLEIIGISADKNTHEWKKAIYRNNLNEWYQIFAGYDKNQTTIYQDYNIQAIPSYILIDKNGEIIDRYLHADSDMKSLEDLDKKLKLILH